MMLASTVLLLRERELVIHNVLLANTTKIDSVAKNQTDLMGFLPVCIRMAILMKLSVNNSARYGTKKIEVAVLILVSIFLPA